MRLAAQKPNREGCQEEPLACMLCLLEAALNIRVRSRLERRVNSADTPRWNRTATATKPATVDRGLLPLYARNSADQDASGSRFPASPPDFFSRAGGFLDPADSSFPVSSASSSNSSSSDSAVETFKPKFLRRARYRLSKRRSSKAASLFSFLLHNAEIAGCKNAISLLKVRAKLAVSMTSRFPI